MPAPSWLTRSKARPSRTCSHALSRAPPCWPGSSAHICFLILATAAGAPGLAASAPDLFRDLGAVTLTLVAYGALFALVGVVLRRPVIPGMLFLFGWELIANLPGYMPRLTVTAYLRSLVHYHPPPEGLFPVVAETLPWTTCVGALLGASVLFLAAAVWIFSRREYVLEQ